MQNDMPVHLSSPDSPGPPGEVPRLTVMVDGTPLGVRAGLGDLVRSIAGLAVGADDLATTEMVLAEVLNNIVEHAYAGRSDGRIEVIVDRHKAALACAISDWGVPMPGNTPPKAKTARIDVPRLDLPEGGFGWSLIHMLTEDLDYLRCGDCNRLTLRIPLEADTAE